jgi:hypothetical protein
MRKELPSEQEITAGGLLSTRSQSKKYRNIVLMTERDVVGEESMHITINDEENITTT